MTPAKLLPKVARPKEVTHLQLDRTIRAKEAAGSFAAKLYDAGEVGSALAELHWDPVEEIKVLTQIAKDPDESANARVAACREIRQIVLDCWRFGGQLAQVRQTTVTHNDAMSDDDVLDIAAETQRALGIVPEDNIPQGDSDEEI